MDGRSLPQELGVGHHEDVVAAEGLLDDAGRPDGHRGLVHDHGLGFEDGTDLVGGGLDVREVGRPVVPHRRRNAQVDELGAAHGAGRTDDELEPAVAHRLPDDVVEPGFDDGDLAPLEPGDPLGVDVGAHHLVADVGEAGAGGQADVPTADDGDLARHCPELPFDQNLA